MKAKIVLLLAVMFVAHSSFAQEARKKTGYTDSLSKSFSTIFNNLGDTCRSLCGKLRPGSTNSYESKLRLPRSTENRFDIASFANYPLIFMSYVPAGDDKPKAAEQLKEIKKEIDSVTITYKKMEYKIVYLPGESKTGENPDYQYKLVNAPAELNGAKIYIRLAYNNDNKRKYMYQYTMGMYLRKDF